MFSTILTTIFILVEINTNTTKPNYISVLPGVQTNFKTVPDSWSNDRMFRNKVGQ